MYLHQHSKPRSCMTYYVIIWQLLVQGTALHCAALNGRESTVIFLQKHGASVDAKDAFGVSKELLPLVSWSLQSSSNTMVRGTLWFGCVYIYCV